MPSPKIKILVLDDSEESTLAVVSAVTSRNVALTCVDSAQEALRLLEKEQFALVILDLSQPGADGFDTAARIRSSKAPDIPIVFLSECDGNDETVRQGYRLGEIVFIRKPASREALKAKVDIFANFHRKEMEIQRRTKQLVNANLKLAETRRKLLERSGELTEMLREQEQAVRRMAALSEELADAKRSTLQTQESRRLFLTNLSHEIRTPMTGLLGMIDFTLDSDLKPDQENQLQIAKKAGKVLVKVINDLLEPGQPVGVAQLAAQPVAARTGVLTVLIAEDDPVIMGLMTMLTAKAGHRVLTAGDGYEALKIWERELPDLVLMDVQMPVLDGLEATRRIRRREKEIGGEVPIYGLTAFVMKEDIESCLAAGMTGHIGKPINFPEVLEVLSWHAIDERPGAAASWENEGGRHAQTDNLNNA